MFSGNNSIHITHFEKTPLNRDYIKKRALVHSLILFFTETKREKQFEMHSNLTSSIAFYALLSMSLIMSVFTTILPVVMS